MPALCCLQRSWPGVVAMGVATLAVFAFVPGAALGLGIGSPVPGASGAVSSATNDFAGAATVTNDANGATLACQLKGSRTVVRDAHARIYQRAGDTFGCLYSRGHRYKVGGYSRDDSGVVAQRNVRIAGAYVAFESYSEGKDGLQYHVINLRTGREVQDVATGPTPGDTGVQGFVFGIGHTTTLQLRATGAVAWIASNRYTPSPQYEVRKRDTNSARGPDGDRGTKLLATGPDIDPKSLRLRRTTLIWSQDGQPRASALGRPR
jgi:hypothetical protein